MIVAALNIPILTRNAEYEIAEAYQTIEQLKSEAELIAEVSLMHAKPFKYSGVVFTLSEAHIVQTYKGDRSGRVSILETGGVYRNVNHTIMGNPAFSRKDQAIVFLKKYEGPVVEEGEDVFVIVGAFQGKFLIREGELVPARGAVGEVAQVRVRSDLQVAP